MKPEQETEIQNKKDKLIEELKKNVKQIMEESVAKKTVYEESSNVSAVCSTVDLCLSLGLRRRSLGLFKSGSSSALLQKISKENEDAKFVFERIEEIEKVQFKAERRKSSSSSDSLKSFSGSLSINKNDFSSNLVSSTSNRFFWIRIALFERRLHHIINYLVDHSERFYDCKRSLLGDRSYGELIASLLAGPSAVSFCKIEQLCDEPPANELVKRHRLSSIKKKSASKFVVRRMISTTADMDERRNSATQARDYVESLHQNRKTSLLFGKNNVLVLPNGRSKPVPGYLSLHKDIEDSVMVKWTPNCLMDSSCSEYEVYDDNEDELPTWDQAIQINIKSILYIHCQGDDSQGTLVFVGIDGVQYPPICFPSIKSLLTFLTCLESSIYPKGYITPPFSSALEKKSGPNGSVEHLNDCVLKMTFSEMRIDNEVFKKERHLDWITNLFQIKKTRHLISAEEFSPSECYGKDTLNIDSLTSEFHSKTMKHSPSMPIKGLCSTMRSQLLSRAFLGWLSYSRHMKTIRNHLNDLVFKDFQLSPTFTSGTFLSAEEWKKFEIIGLEKEEVQNKILRYIFCGGVEHCLRSKVWLYLLGYYCWEDSDDEKSDKARSYKLDYERKISEWGAIEMIVNQQERERIERIRQKQKESYIEVFDSPTYPHVEDTDNSSNSNDEEHLKSSSQSELRLINSESGDENRTKSFNGNKTDRRNSIDNSFFFEKRQCDGDSLCSSTESCDGGKYSMDLLELFRTNIQRVDKDVSRCDRNSVYFSSQRNLDKLRNVVTTYVWDNLEVGYMQGMCDIAAPLLVVLEDECKVHCCFAFLMKRLINNFPTGNQMDLNFANMRALIEVLDPCLHEKLHENEDVSNFFFSYRWFLLDFKREFSYESVFVLWETIWVAERIVSSQFCLFVAMGLLSIYRDIILDRNMDFTEVIKFFNDMAEQHDITLVINESKKLLIKLQQLVQEQ